MGEQTEQPTRTVYQAIAAVIKELPPIPKDQRGPANQGGYAYRGIEQIKGHAQQLMAAQGVIYAPRAKLKSREPARPEGWFDYCVQFTWIVKGPGGDTYKDDEGKLPRTIGIGRDNSDKGINKAHSQAEKYLLVSLLQIADQEDSDAHGDYGAQTAADANPPADRGVQEALVARVNALSADAKAGLVKAWTAADPDGVPYLPAEDGKPRIGLLRVNDVLAAEALILDAEKADGVSAAEGSPQPTSGPETAAEPSGAPQPAADAPTPSEGLFEWPSLEGFDEWDISEAIATREGKEAVSQAMRDAGAPLAEDYRTLAQAAVWELPWQTLDKRLTEANVVGFKGADVDVRRMALLARIYRAERSSRVPTLSYREGEEPF